MSKLKVFISYCKEDEGKKNYLRDLLSESRNLEPIVVPERFSDLETSGEKIEKFLRQSRIILPIMTENSLSNQWVNQEIGYAFSFFKKEDIKPIVEKSIQNKLKGFITFERDLNYRFENEDEFKIQAKLLVEDLKEKFRNYGSYSVY